jgi:hypothetical protein
MPQIPYSPVPNVTADNIPTPAIRVNAPEAAFGTNIAQAIKGLGATEEGVGNELFSRALAMQQLRNESEATEASADYIKRSDQLFTNYEGQKRGINAVTGEVEHREAQDKLRKEVREGLSSPIVQKMYDAKTFGDFNRALFNGARHAAAENRSAISNSYQAEIDAAADTAINAKSPEEFNRKLQQIDSTTRDFGASSGLPSDAVEQLAFKHKSRATVNYIEGLARRDPVAARKVLDENIEAGTLHGADRDRIEARVHSQLMTTGSSHFVEQNENDFRNPEGFLARRGAPRAQGIDYTFGQNLVSAITNYERATGKSAKIESLVRTTEEQARIRAEHEAMPGGVEAHPAAQPGTSRHEFGRAADVDEGFAAWLKEGDRAQKYGLEFLKGKTGVNDPNHVQLAGDAPLRRTRTYDINERDYVEGAVGRMRASLPNAPPEMEDRIRREAQSLYARNAQYDRQQDEANLRTIQEPLLSDNPPRTLSDLLKLGPEYANAWNQLPPKLQDAALKRINKDSTTDQAFYHQQLGMAAGDEDARRQFISPENYEAIQTTDKLSRAKQDELTKKILSLRNKPEHDPSVALAWRSIRYTLPEELQKPGDLQNQYKGALQTMLRLYGEVHGGKFPSQPELTEMGQRIQNEVTIPGELDQPKTPYDPLVSGLLKWWNSRSGRLFEVTPPKQEYDKVKDTLTKLMNATPSDEMINQVYRRDLYQRLYGSK